MKLKLILVLVVIILLPFLGAGGYYYYTTQKAKQAPAKPVDDESAKKDTSRVILVADEPVVSHVLSFSGDSIWYMTDNGKMYRQGVDSQTREEFLLPPSDGQPSQIIWSTTGGDFITESLQDGHVRYQYYSAAKQVFVPYPGNIRAVRFLEDDAKIVYDWVTGTGSHELKNADPDGTNFQKIADLFQPDYQIVPSPTKNEVILFAPRESGEGSRLMLVDLQTGKFTDIDVKRDLYQGAKFSPDGRRLLAFAPSDQGGTTYLYDLATSDKYDLGLGLETSQVAWDQAGNKIYHADGSGVFVYDLERRQSEAIFSFANMENFRPQSLLVSPDGRFAFFVNEGDGKLYRAELTGSPPPGR